jgi:hypothetical protein
MTFKERFMIYKKGHRLLRPYLQSQYGVGYQETKFDMTYTDMVEKIDYDIVDTHGKRVRVQEKICTESGFMTVVCGENDFCKSKADVLIVAYFDPSQASIMAAISCGMDAYREYIRRRRDSPIFKTGPNRGKFRMTNKLIKWNDGEHEDKPFLAPPFSYLIDEELSHDLCVVQGLLLTPLAHWVLDKQRIYYRQPDYATDMFKRFGEQNG